MSYDAGELFRFENVGGGYSVAEYLKKDDPSVAELEIPEEYNGKPVVRIKFKAFMFAEHLKSVRLPKSLKEIEDSAFAFCRELERVEFNGSPIIEPYIFDGCPKLPPETIVIGLVRSTDITRPLFDKNNPSIRADIGLPRVSDACFRPGVFELLAKNNSFRNLSPKRVVRGIIDENRSELLPLAEQCGMLENEKLLKNLISYSAERRRVECTAYLLEYKNRKFGRGSEKRISSFEVDEVLGFEKTDDGYALAEYLKKDDLRVTRLAIPEEYNGEPIMRINSEAFMSAKHLKSVTLPKGLKEIDSGAFALCTELERVDFNSSPIIGPNVFRGCPKLSPETVVMGLVRSIDITNPVSNEDIPEITAKASDTPCDCFRPDVFELLARHNCFRGCDLERVFIEMVNRSKPELFPIAAQYEMLENAELLDLLIGSAIEKQQSEIAAYLSELKNRKFGFD